MPDVSHERSLRQILTRKISITHCVYGTRIQTRLITQCTFPLRTDSNWPKSLSIREILRIIKRFRTRQTMKLPNDKNYFILPLELRIPIYNLYFGIYKHICSVFVAKFMFWNVSNPVN